MRAPGPGGGRDRGRTRSHGAAILNGSPLSWSGCVRKFPLVALEASLVALRDAGATGIKQFPRVAMQSAFTHTDSLKVALGRALY
jgi:hypothetical protein